MKSAIIALCFVACAYATSDQEAQVLSSSYDLSPEGNFQYGFETNNGISGRAEGVVKSFGKDESALEVTGTNAFKSPEGDVYQVSYIANENGYQATGAHLPTPPAPQAIPDYILRSLEYIRTHPYTEKN